LSIVRRPESLPDIVTTAVSMVAGQAAGKSMVLRQELPADLPMVSADAGRIGQVIGNLLANAVKFTEAGGRITVRARVTTPMIEVAVADTGPGIPLNEQSRVFERFWQSNPTAGRGSGLGLAIARGIVEAHGGRIWVESEPGRGSAFHFTIPIEAS
jgi:signal transduction histidine kinase